MRSSGRALRLHRSAVGGVVFRPRCQPGEPSPFKWTYHFSFGVAEFAKAYISEWSNGQVPTNKKVGVMFPNDADGNALRAHMVPIIEKAGFTVFDPGGDEDGTTDYSSQIGKYKGAGVQDFYRRADTAGLRHLLAASRSTRLGQDYEDPEHR